MIEFQVPAISCNHCVRAVTQAIQRIDPQATVEVDLPSHRVRIAGSAERPALAEALTDAGYPPA